MQKSLNSSEPKLIQKIFFSSSLPTPSSIAQSSAPFSPLALLGGILVSGLIGILVFFCLFPVDFLNPLFYSWLFQADASVYFLGFNFFNHEPWHWPLGLIRAYSFPEMSSVVYTDSIPIISLILKIFHFKPFYQFHGYWILLCFFLQGSTAFLLLQTFTRAMGLSILGSTFFVLLPTFLNRAYGTTTHYSLLAHFLILISIFLFYHPSFKNNIYAWTTLWIVSLGIHFYLACMIGLFWIASNANQLSQIKIKKSFFSILGLTIFFSYLYGYFSVPLGNSTAGGFGLYSMNLNALINPAGMSSWLPSLSFESPLQFEGFQYLGLGLILVALIYGRRDLWTSLPQTLQFGLIFLFLLSVSFRISISNFVIPEMISIPLYFCIFFLFLKKDFTLAKRILFSILLLSALFACGKVLRASGRLFWPIEYLGLFLILIKKPSSWVIAVLIAVQLYDLSPQFRSIQAQNKGFSQTPIPENPLPEVSTHRYDHVALVNPQLLNPFYFAYSALINHQTIGPLTAARGRSSFRKAEQTELTQKILQHDLSPRTLYIIGSEEFWKTFTNSCKNASNSCKNIEWNQNATYRYLLMR